MLKNSRAQMIAMLAVGGLLGYVAASGKLDVFHSAKAEPPQQSLADKESSAVKAAACCSEGLTKGQLVAMADPRAAGPLAKAEADGKKPNIVFIMGDDVGWFNIGAYHRGIMSGKTPNLDKLASQGMLFTDYYAEASCTAGRANFITGEIPLRTGLTTVGQAGADVGLPAQACTLATALKAQGLRHRSVRQEPSWRPEQVPADGARLRRILRLPVPPRRHVGSVLVFVPVGPGFLQHVWAAHSRALLCDRRR